jgi:tRNA A-37 threonylcarbamoyl transferase component Bud32
MFSKKNEAEIFEVLEKYRISSEHSNAAYKIPHLGRFVFLKIYRKNNSGLIRRASCLFAAMRNKLPVQYASPARRKAFEEETLRHWRKCGYCVPAVLENPFTQLNPFVGLVTEFIDGLTLRELVGGGKNNREDLRRLFCEIEERHEKALRLEDNKLFHIDANARNIIFTTECIFRVDFEMGRPWEPPLVCARREILKMLVSLGDEVPLESREETFRLFKECYRRQEVYDFINRGVLQRPFQKWHQSKEKKKKRKNPRKITLYEIVSLLQN